MKIAPYYQRQKCSPMTSFRKCKVHVDICGGSHRCVVDDCNFWRFGWLLLRKRYR